MPTANDRATSRARPGAIVLLTALGLAALLSPFPEYWDPKATYELIRRDREQLAHDAKMYREAAADVAREEQARQAAREAARLQGRVSGSVRGIFDGFVTDVFEQPDGKVLVGGAHNGFGLGLARLTIDGSLDDEFVRHANWDLASDVAGVIDQVALAPDGKVAVVGRFSFHGAPRWLLRFHPDGRLDAPFVAATSTLPVAPSVSSHGVAVQPDGAIVVVESGYPSPPTIRLRSDGTVDRGWDPRGGGVSWDEPMIGADRRLVPRPPGLEDAGRFRIQQASMGLRSEAEPGALARIRYLGVQPDGRTLVLRQRAVVAPPPPKGRYVFVGDDPPPWESQLIRVAADGAREELRLGATRCGPPDQPFDVAAIAFQADGGAVIAGDLPLPRIRPGDDCEHVTIWRITPRGALDPQFRTTARHELVQVSDPARLEMQTPSMVNKVVVLRDGRIVIGGTFTSVQGQPRLHLARLRPDGSLE